MHTLFQTENVIKSISRVLVISNKTLNLSFYHKIYLTNVFNLICFKLKSVSWAAGFGFEGRNWSTSGFNTFSDQINSKKSFMSNYRIVRLFLTIYYMKYNIFKHLINKVDQL